MKCHGCVTVVAEKQETGERCKKTGESKEKVKMPFLLLYLLQHINEEIKMACHLVHVCNLDENSFSFIYSIKYFLYMFTHSVAVEL